MAHSARKVSGVALGLLTTGLPAVYSVRAADPPADDNKLVSAAYQSRYVAAIVRHLIYL